VDVAAVARAAHASGAEVFVDAVHYAPHGPIDVQQLDCDYLVCSGYKIFAPHMGFAYCRREAIENLPTFREHFIPDAMPDKLEAGTYAYESVAGMDASIGYIESLSDAGGSRVERLRSAMTRIAGYERDLSTAMLEAIESLPAARVHGICDRSQLRDRVPTIAFSIEGILPSAIADGLAANDVGLRSGHMYSPRLIARLGQRDHGVVRASLAHYNTIAEVDRFRSALASVIGLAARMG
jgi:selenocysteine lyase/cysteine desulfurase